jgi:hypothetical protein
VIFLAAGFAVTAGFGFSDGVCTKVLGAAVIFTGTMSLYAGKLCPITQFFNLKKNPISALVNV